MTDMKLDAPNTASTNDPSLKDHLANAGAEMKQRATEALQASTDVARDKMREAADVTKDVAAETFDHVQERARTQQNVGADFAGKFAQNMRGAAHAFDDDLPLAARGINAAADYVDAAAERVRNGSLKDLLDGATDFAKRQPTAFLGLAVLAGFAAVRFLKAAGGSTDRNAGDTRP